MHWFGVAGEYNTMVMELLGQNLEDLFIFCTRNFTLKTILLIGCEIVIRNLIFDNFISKTNLII